MNGLQEGKTIEKMEKEKSQWVLTFTTLNGWVDWDGKMETIVDSADARELLDNIIEVCLRIE